LLTQKLPQSKIKEFNLFFYLAFLANVQYQIRIAQIITFESKFIFLDETGVFRNIFI